MSVNLHTSSSHLYEASFVPVSSPLLQKSPENKSSFYPPPISLHSSHPLVVKYKDLFTLCSKQHPCYHFSHPPLTVPPHLLLLSEMITHVINTFSREQVSRSITIANCRNSGKRGCANTALHSLLLPFWGNSWN